MTEEQWLSAVTPGRMLWHIQKTVKGRKPALFGAACLRRIWHLLPGPHCRLAVEMLESFAEGTETREQLTAARGEAREEGYRVETGGNQDPRVLAAMSASDDDPSGDPETLASLAAEATAWVNVGTPQAISEPEERAQAELVREIFGNPFRSIQFDPSWRRWNDGRVTKLAEKMYGVRCFDDLPLLANALEEAGCHVEEILAHCRAPGPHVRGCWVLDLVLDRP